MKRSERAYKSAHGRYPPDICAQFATMHVLFDIGCELERIADALAEEE